MDGPAEAKRSGRAPGHPGARNALILGLLALALFVAGSCWLALYPTVPRDLGGAPNLDARARHVRIPLEGGDHLDGWLLRGRRKATVVIFHGYGRDHTRAWRYAQFLERAGYGVLAADFRSSRALKRKPTTLGYYELEDARALLGWLERESPVKNDRVALFGESLGGSVALAVAAEHPGVAGVVVDCPFATGRRALEDAFERWAHLPRWPLAPAAGIAAAVLTGHDPAGLDAVAAVRRLDRRPVLFIGSVNDDRLAISQTEDLWRAAGGRDSLWILPDCGHNQGWLRHRAEYERRVLAFYQRAFSRTAHAETRATPRARSGS